MGTAATLAMAMCGMAGIFRIRSRAVAKAAQVPVALLEMSARSTTTAWIGIGIGAALTALSYFLPSIPTGVLGLDPSAARELSAVIGFVILGAANFNDGMRLRQLSTS